MKNSLRSVSLVTNRFALKFAPLPLAAVMLAQLAGSGCTTPGKDTAIGAGAGAAGGAVIGGLAGGGKGAAIGAAAGAALGGAFGNYLDKRTKELNEVAEAQRTKDGILVKLKNDLLFDTGKAELKPEAQTQLTQLGAILAKYPGDQIQVLGFTDSTGSDTTNQRLSDERANSVEKTLAANGVPATEMVAQGKGETMPVASNSSAEGRAKNRRVELHIVPAPPKKA